MHKIITVILITITVSAGFSLIKNRISREPASRRVPPTSIPVSSSTPFSASISPIPSSQNTPQQGTGKIYKPGSYNESISVDGRIRTYALYIPKGYSFSRRYPLVAVFHGGGGDGRKIASQTGFPTKADQEGFIAVFPDGIDNHWDDGRDVIVPPINDVKFVRTLVMHLQTKLLIDENKVYATGVSNGGILTHRLACEMANVFAAIGADVGSLATNMLSRCSPSNPIAVAVIQGTRDPIVPISGGMVTIGIGGRVESAENAMHFWASKNGCASPPVVTNLPPRVQDGTRVTQTHYAACSAHGEVTYYIVDGMGHLWPPKSQVTRGGAAGPPSANIDATEVFWEFFKTHAKK
ncbi:MAG: PHB depolymerase family esterase [Candidatus Sungbacteria bacterium]|nr:PHB depolymerase family esterase [bacterium]MDZ4260194.1 PHB depolymerase family esterase [Candidatus Sungbacteria bacterium]